MDWESKKKARFIVLTFAFVIYLLLTVYIVVGPYGFWEKLACIIGLFILFIWMISAGTDILTGKSFSKYSFYVSGGIGSHEAASILQSYLHAQGAKLVNDEDLADFRITLVSEGPGEFLCWIRDRMGHEDTVRKSDWNWPRPIALEINRFIRENAITK